MLNQKLIGSCIPLVRFSQCPKSEAKATNNTNKMLATFFGEWMKTLNMDGARKQKTNFNLV